VSLGVEPLGGFRQGYCRRMPTRSGARLPRLISRRFVSCRSPSNAYSVPSLGVASTTPAPPTLKTTAAGKYDTSSVPRLRRHRVRPVRRHPRHRGAPPRIMEPSWRWQRQVDLPPAEVAAYLVPRLEVRDRQERAGTVEGDGHGEKARVGPGSQTTDFRTRSDIASTNPTKVPRLLAQSSAGQLPAIAPLRPSSKGMCS
jgi:hypothetical protein